MPVLGCQLAGEAKGLLDDVVKLSLALLLCFMVLESEAIIERGKLIPQPLAFLAKGMGPRGVRLGKSGSDRATRFGKTGAGSCSCALR